jgi:hypothetical protein
VAGGGWWACGGLAGLWVGVLVGQWAIWQVCWWASGQAAAWPASGWRHVGPVGRKPGGMAAGLAGRPAGWKPGL